MMSDFEVFEIIAEWSGRQPDSMYQTLEACWLQGRPRNIPFFPDAVHQLLQLLFILGFQGLSEADFGLYGADFRLYGADSSPDSGHIQTVQDLVDALPSEHKKKASDERNGLKDTNGGTKKRISLLKENAKSSFMGPSGPHAAWGEEESEEQTRSSHDEPKPAREVTVTASRLDGTQVTQFEAGQPYRLLFRVGTPRSGNLASGNKEVKDIPRGGLPTHWVITSANVEFLEPLSTAKLQKIGDAWIAEFDLLIPEAGESDTGTVGIKAGAGAGKLVVSIYAVSAQENRELYREVSVSLDGAPAVAKDETCKAPGHVHLKTTHEWTTPAEHIQVSIVNGLAIVSTQKLALQRHDFFERFTATDTLISGAIGNVRDSLEKLRENHGDYLDNMNAADLTTRLATPCWMPYSWAPLPDGAGMEDKAAFAQVQASSEWQSLASDGYALYDGCFPQGTKLRALLEQLSPGSRIDFHWTDQSGPGFVSHVPWALMYMEPVDVTGQVLPDPAKFLGLHFRIGTRSWDVNNGSAALGGLDSTYSMDLLYWGDKAGDDVAEESRWQASEYKMWKWSKLLPDPAQPDLKRQLILALDQPAPAPVAVLYFYCHASVGDGAQPVLRFGNTSKREDTLLRTELSSRSLPDGPLVFANACTTAQADPHMTSELEQKFFGRGVRAFIGTETKVPIRLASKFAWLYFQFLYRRADPQFQPMSAGEALTQARMFLWTQHRNVGGLFYSMTNQYDLYLASNEEVLALAR